MSQQSTAFAPTTIVCQANEVESYQSIINEHLKDHCRSWLPDYREGNCLAEAVFHAGLGLRIHYHVATKDFFYVWTSASQQAVDRSNSAVHSIQKACYQLFDLLWAENEVKHYLRGRLENSGVEAAWGLHLVRSCASRSSPAAPGLSDMLKVELNVYQRGISDRRIGEIEFDVDTGSRVVHIRDLYSSYKNGKRWREWLGETLIYCACRVAREAHCRVLSTHDDYPYDDRTYKLDELSRGRQEAVLAHPLAGTTRVGQRFVKLSQRDHRRPYMQ